MKTRRKSNSATNENPEPSVSEPPEDSKQTPQNAQQTTKTRKKNLQENPEKSASDELNISALIKRSRHPFEKDHFIESKSLTCTQRAITCCIQQNGGRATENEILAFVTDNWSILEKMGAKLATPLPDLRILRINLSVKKKSVPLFLCTNTKPTEWMVNESHDEEMQQQKNKPQKDAKEANESAEKQKGKKEEAKEISHASAKQPRTFNDMLILGEARGSFESSVTDTLAKFPGGLTIDQLSKETEKIADCSGLFESLDHERRVRAVLIAKKAIGQVVEKDGVWFIAEDEDSIRRRLDEINSKKLDYLPQCMRTIRITDMTLDEFYSALKENKVF